VKIILYFCGGKRRVRDEQFVRRIKNSADVVKRIFHFGGQLAREGRPPFFVRDSIDCNTKL
jgi:hypothetical protein